VADRPGRSGGGGSWPRLEGHPLPQWPFAQFPPALKGRGERRERPSPARRRPSARTPR